jgi:hypothetical protein
MTVETSLTRSEAQKDRREKEKHARLSLAQKARREREHLEVSPEASGGSNRRLVSFDEDKCAGTNYLPEPSRQVQVVRFCDANCVPLPVGARASRLAHCAVCHQTFGGVTGFDAHRVGSHGPERRCLDSAGIVSLGLTPDGKGIWRRSFKVELLAA